MIESIHNTISHALDQLALWAMLAALGWIITITVLPILERISIALAFRRRK